MASGGPRKRPFARPSASQEEGVDSDTGAQRQPAPAAPPQKAAKSEDQPAARGPAPLDDPAIADLVEKTIGQRPLVLRSGHVRIITLGDEEEARSLLTFHARICWDVIQLLGIDPRSRIWEGTADFYLVQTRKQYLALVRYVISLYVPDRGLLDWCLVNNTVLQSIAPVGAWILPDAPSRNFMAHHLGHHVLENMVYPRRKHLAPAWLTWGFGWHLQYKYTGSITLHRTRIDTQYGVRELLEKGLDSGQGWPGRVARSRVRESVSSPFPRSKRSFINRWDRDDQAQIWSLVHFLVKEHPREFARWLTLMQTQLPDTAFPRCLRLDRRAGRPEMVGLDPRQPETTSGGIGEYYSNTGSVSESVSGSGSVSISIPIPTQESHPSTVPERPAPRPPLLTS